MTGLASLGLFLAVAQAAQQPLTLADALKLGEQSSFGLKIADSQVEKARQKANESIGALGPKLNLEASYTRFDKGFNSFGSGASPIDSKDAKLVLSMPIDLFGRTGRAVRSGARLSIAVAEANRAAALRDLHQAIKKAFFGVLQARAVVTVSTDAKERAAQRLKNAQAELAAGSRARVDVIRFETAVAQAESDLVTAQSNFSLAKNLLNNALGRAIETPIEVAEQPIWKPTDQSEEELAKIASENRPELTALRLASELQSSVRQVEERGLAPSLNLGANHTRSFGPLGQGSRPSSTTGVISLSMPIWDSGITRARIKAARADEELAKQQLEQASLGVSLEVRQALVNLKSAGVRVTVAEQQEKLADESYRLTVIKFEAGEGIPLEVADAATQLTQARTQLVNARYDYLRAVADLERAIGKDLMPEGSR